jgi:hypothetical protein
VLPKKECGLLEDFLLLLYYDNFSVLHFRTLIAKGITNENSPEQLDFELFRALLRS